MCLQAKADRLTLCANLESQYSDKTNQFFITLTYDNRYIPTFTLKHVDKGYYDLVDEETGECFGTEFLTWKERLKLLAKCNLGGRIPYLLKADMQLFVKRLRKELDKYGIKIRFYACGEYGPKHFRPHFHLLIWSEDEQIGTLLPALISEKWPYGRTDCQRAQGDAASYVAGYVSSFSFVPDVLKKACFAPFNTHSKEFGARTLRTYSKEIYDAPIEDIIRKGVTVAGKYSEFNVWRSCYSAWFPKCCGYDNKDSHGRYRTFLAYRTAKGLFSDESLSIIDIAYKVAGLSENRRYVNWSSHIEYASQFLDDIAGDHPTKYKLDELGIPLRDANGDLVSNEDYEEQFERFVSRIYNRLLLSKHFIDLCHDNDILYSDMLINIEQFYTKLDYYRLTKEYEKQEIYFNDELSEFDDVVLFYDNVATKRTVQDTNIYEYQKMYAESRFEKAIKHKHLMRQKKIINWRIKILVQRYSFFKK